MILSHDFGSCISILLQTSLASQENKRLSRWTPWKCEIPATRYLFVYIFGISMNRMNDPKLPFRYCNLNLFLLTLALLFKLSGRYTYFTLLLSIHDLLHTWPSLTELCWWRFRSQPFIVLSAQERFQRFLSSSHSLCRWIA